MGLVNQKNIVLPHALSKEPFQIHMRVKQIIVVADNRVRKQAHIKTKLKRTDHMLFCTGNNRLPVKIVLFGQQLVNRIVYTVIVPSGIGTVIRVALRFLHKADFVPCGQYDGLEPKSLFSHQFNGVAGHGSCDGFGREIKDSLSYPLPHGLYGRKQCGDGLSGPGRSLYEQFSFMINCLIDI